MTQPPPAEIGMHVDEVDTPALLIEMASFEHNLQRMADRARELGVALRPHAKMHKSPEIAAIQLQLGAVGQCCQKLSEAEILVESGIGDVFISNQVVGPRKLERLANLAANAKISVCVDDLSNLSELSAVAKSKCVNLDVLVEIDVGSGRCGVRYSQDAVTLAHAIDQSEHLTFVGLQAYHGGAQHIREYSERRAAIQSAAEKVRATKAALQCSGLSCTKVSGGGTGSFEFEGETCTWDEFQCGSYAFMDADYGRNLMEDGSYFKTFEQSLFVLATVMSRPEDGLAVMDAGLKAIAVDSGYSVPYGLLDVEHVGASDEHGKLILGINAPLLTVGTKIRLIPGHCDPTVNLHDWYVCVRDGVVENVWPIAARGAVF
jgi:3-hydroxy-D-aspartate aldolase